MPRCRHLVDAAGAVHNPGTIGAEEQQRARHQLRQLRLGHADQLPLRAGRIRQRPQQVECGPHAKLPPHGGRLPHGRMKRRRKEKCDAHRVQRTLHHRRRGRQIDAQLLEYICASAAARHRAIAMLGHANTRRRNHQRRGR